MILHLTAITISHANIQSVVWKEVRSGIRDSDLQKAAASPDNPDTAYASSLRTVYRTTDGGSTCLSFTSLFILRIQKFYLSADIDALTSSFLSKRLAQTK